MKNKVKCKFVCNNCSWIFSLSERAVKYSSNIRCPKCNSKNLFSKQLERIKLKQRIEDYEETIEYLDNDVSYRLKQLEIERLKKIQHNNF